MGAIKPVYNNFSSGEITPKLFGRTDSPVYQTGAERMENFIPDHFGSCRRRGGFQYIDTIPGVERVIPWSIDNDLDILILLANQSMKFYAVWRNGVVANWFLEAIDPETSTTTQINITEIDNDPQANMYATTAIKEIKYTQGIRTMYLAHKDYPLFYIRFIDYQVDTGYTLEYGPVAFSGNIASTPEVDPGGVIVSTDPITSTDILQRLSILAVNVDYTVDPNTYINGFQIATVKRTTVGAAASVDVFLETILTGTNWPSNGRKYGGDSISLGADGYLQFKAANGVAAVTLYSPTNTYTAYGIMAAMRNAQLTPSCGVFMKRYGFGKSDYDGSFILNEATTKNVITFTKVGGGTIEVLDTTSGLTGYIKVTGPGGKIIEINKNTVLSGGNLVLDNVAAWMTPDIQYPCSNESLGITFQGFYPQYAMKKLTGENRIPELWVYRGTIESATREVIRSGDKAITGQLLVNLNPMARSQSFPGFVCFHQNRLVFGGSTAEPNVLYMSKINDHTNIQFFDEIEFEQNILKNKDDWVNPNVPEWDIKNATVQQISADSAICLRIMTDENEAIQWGASVKDLVLGTNTSEWIIPSDITAHTPTVTLTSRNGSASLQGRFIGKGIIFVSRTGNDIKSFNAQFGEMGDSISAQAEHIFREGGGITGFDFRQDPYTEVFTVLADGKAAAAVLNEQALGFYRISTRDDDDIKSIAIISENDEDGVYAVVDRATSGGTTRFLERLTTCDDSAFATRSYLDHWIRGTTSGAGAIAGLSHFYRAGFNSQDDAWISFGDSYSGQPVVQSDGTCSAYIDSATGVSTPLPVSTAYIIGYRYASHLKLSRTDSVEIEGLSKQGGAMYLRLYKSGDVFLVRDYDTSQLVQVYTPNNALGARQYPYSGGIRVENIAPAGPDQNVELMIDTHESATIQSIAAMFSVGEGI